MDASRGLVTKLCDEGRILQVIRSGVEEGFLDEDSQLVFTFIRRHFNQYKETPSRDAVKRAFPNYEFANYKEPIEYFIDEIKESYRRNVLEEKLEELGNIYTADSTKAEGIFRETLQELSIASKTFKDVNIAESALDRVKDYEKRRDSEAEDGILSGWPKMDYQTLGFHPEEFVVLVGEKYVGKSWTMLWLAYKAASQGYRVLFVTKEMSTQAIERRHDSVFSQVRFDALRRGELTNGEEKRYKEKMDELHNSSYSFTVARDGIATVEDIKAKAIETDAEIVFGDSIYLFLPDGKNNYNGETSKRLAISQKCKEIARELSVPFIVSVQAGRKKTKSKEPDLDDIEWSNAFSQDADTVFYVEKTELDRELDRNKIYLLKSRDGDITTFFVDTNFNYMTFEERSDKDEPTTEIVFEDEDESESEEDVLSFEKEE